MKRVVLLDRSELAKNVYLMMLSKLDRIQLVSPDIALSIDRIADAFNGADLVLISHSAVTDRRNDFRKALSNFYQEASVPCIMFVSAAAGPEWKAFRNVGRVELMERPFYPADFIGRVKNMWGMK